MRNPLFCVLLISIIMIWFIGCAKQPGDKMPVTTASDEAKQHFLAGRDIFEKLRIQESLDHFQKAVEKDSNFATAYFYYAQAQPTAKGFFENMDKAIALVDKISEAEGNIILGFHAGIIGMPMEQRTYYQKSVQAFPNDERAHNFLAASYFGQQEYENAIQEYNKAVEINPNFSPAYNQLGYAYRFLEKYEDAEKAFKKYTELIPDDPNPYDSYAELLLKMGRFEESIVQYKKALEHNPNFVASHVGIATNLNYLDRNSEAREQCQKLFEIARDDGEKRTAIFTMAVSFVNEGNLEMALQKLGEQYALAKEINDAAAMAGDLNTMGNIYFEKGEFEKAMANYEMANKVFQESDLSEDVKENAKMGYLFNQSIIAMKSEDFKTANAKAKEYLDKATEKNNPTQIRTGNGLMGRIAMEEKDYSAAIGYFEKANQQNPYNLYRMALCYKAQDDLENAKIYCEKAANFNSLNSMTYAFCRKAAKAMLTDLI